MECHFFNGGPQIPLLDVNTRAPLHCRHNPTKNSKAQHRRNECTKSLVQRLGATGTKAGDQPHLLPLSAMSDLWTAYGEDVLSLEQTLDEYCHHSLKNIELYDRDHDQVLSRYLQEPKTSRKSSTGGEIPSEIPDEADLSMRHHDCAKDRASIVVVSNLVIWRLGG